MAGQPRKQVDYDELKALLTTGLTKTSIASHLNISRPTLERVIEDNDLVSIKQR